MKALLTVLLICVIPVFADSDKEHPVDIKLPKEIQSGWNFLTEKRENEKSIKVSSPDGSAVSWLTPAKDGELLQLTLDVGDTESRLSVMPKFEPGNSEIVFVTSSKSLVRFNVQSYSIKGKQQQCLYLNSEDSDRLIDLLREIIRAKRHDKKMKSPAPKERAP